MAYAKLTSASAIQAYFKGVVFSADTTPTLESIDEFIDTATAIIYGSIQDKYIIPITDACDLLQLKELAELYVLTKVKMIIGKSTPRILSDGRMVPNVESQKEFYQRLDKYAKCEIVLPNSSNNSSNLMSESYNSDNDIVTVSEKDVDQW